MVPLSSARLGSFVAGFIGLASAVIACSASGEATEEYIPTQEQEPTEPSNSVKLPPKSGTSAAPDDAPTTSSSGGASSLLDAGTGPDGSTGAPAPAPADAGTFSSAPAVGATCGTIDQKFKKTCGRCGTHEAICVSTPDGTSGTVTDYGPCSGENGVCDSGSTEPCGKCGTRTCGNSCAWGSCQNQGVCKAGQIQHDTAGCPVLGTYRAQPCTNTCAWGSFSACAEPSVTLPAVGDTSSTIWELKTTAMGKRPTSCKRTASLSTVPVFAVKLVNPTSADAVVQIWHSSAGAAVDTTIHTYLRDQPPATDDEWKLCHTESVDDCSKLSDICAVDGAGHWAGVDNVRVPANSTLVVMSAGYSSGTKGKFVLNIKTKSN